MIETPTIATAPVNLYGIWIYGRYSKIPGSIKEHGGCFEECLQGCGALVIYDDLDNAREHCRMYRDELGDCEPVLIASTPVRLQY